MALVIALESLDASPNRIALFLVAPYKLSLISPYKDMAETKFISSGFSGAQGNASSNGVVIA